MKRYRDIRQHPELRPQKTKGRNHRAMEFRTVRVAVLPRTDLAGSWDLFRQILKKKYAFSTLASGEATVENDDLT